MMLSKTMYAGVRWRVCNRVPLPETCSAGRILLALIGHRASVGGSVSHTDWACVNGAVDMSPGGFWIDYIRQALWGQPVSRCRASDWVTCLLYFVQLSGHHGTSR